MQAAPLWDAVALKFVGLLTVSDFISILLHYSTSASASMSDLSSRTIKDVIRDVELNKLLRHSSFVGAHTTADLHQCCSLMDATSLDYLPIILPADARVLSTITYTTVLEYLVTQFREQRRLFDDSIYDLGIGTYENVITVTPQIILSEVLTLMEKHNLSVVPVLDEQNRVVTVYSRSDITFLATATDADSAVSNLQLSLGDILSQQRTDVSTPDRLYKCSPHQTLQSIFEMFASVRFNRLVCVDEEGRCVGIVSARDIVKYFIST